MKKKKSLPVGVHEGLFLWLYQNRRQAAQREIVCRERKKEILKRTNMAFMFLETSTSTSNSYRNMNTNFKVLIYPSKWLSVKTSFHNFHGHISHMSPEEINLIVKKQKSSDRSHKKGSATGKYSLQAQPKARPWVAAGGQRCRGRTAVGRTQNTRGLCSLSCQQAPRIFICKGFSNDLI